MIMLPADPQQECLDRMRDELSAVLDSTTARWVVELKDRDVFIVVQRDTNVACIATTVARLSGVNLQRIDELIESQVGSDFCYLRIAQWLWAQSVCPANSLEVDDLIARISRVIRLADDVLTAAVWGHPSVSQARPGGSRPRRRKT